MHLMILIAAMPAIRAAAEQRIVVHVASRKLALMDGDSVVRLYDVAVGKVTTPTPAGHFQIVIRLEHFFGIDAANAV